MWPQVLGVLLKASDLGAWSLGSAGHPGGMAVGSGKCFGVRE